MNSVLSINERATEHCAQMAPSDLVCAWSPPDVDGSYHESPTSSKALSTDQRCFSQFDRKTDCFDGGQSNYGLLSRLGAKTLAVKVKRIIRRVPADPWATFKAVCGTQTRMPQGFKLMSNQIQALTTPVNLVGGSREAGPYQYLFGSRPPNKGGG